MSIQALLILHIQYDFYEVVISVYIQSCDLLLSVTNTLCKYFWHLHVSVIWCFIVSLDYSLLNDRVAASCVQEQEQVCELFSLFLSTEMFLHVNSQSILLKNSLFSPFLLYFDFYTQFQEMMLAVRHILYLCSLPSQFKACCLVVFRKSYQGWQSVAFVILNVFQLCLIWIMILLALSFLHFAFILI